MVRLGAGFDLQRDRMTAAGQAEVEPGGEAEPGREAEPGEEAVPGEGVLRGSHGFWTDLVWKYQQLTCGRVAVKL